MKKLMMAIAAVALATAGTYGDSFWNQGIKEVVEGVTWTYDIENGEAIVYGHVEGLGLIKSYYPAIPNTTTGAVVIPERLGGCVVTKISSYAFYGCSGITSVGIPSTVTSIGSKAFYGCGELTSITIPSKVTSIEDCTFYGCGQLTTMELPQGVTSIGSDAFYNCSGLTSVTIPSSVTSVGSEAFYNCSGIESVYIQDLAGWCSIDFPGSSANPLYYSKKLYLNGVQITGTLVIPDGVVGIGSCAFSHCNWLTEVKIPESARRIGEYAFQGCKCLKSVLMPMCMTSIGNSAFSGCESLLSMTIPSGVSVVEGHVFSFCSSLESVSIPEGVSNIENSAFAYCKNLSSVSIPNGVVRIGHYAFQDCSGLISLSIPESVSEVNSGAFSGCENLGWVEIDPANTYLRVKRGKVVTSSGLLIHDCSLLVRVLSSQIRVNDPAILDVSYRIRSRKPTVKVCVLAFEDGVRSFAKVVRPETFIDGTGVNVGDAVTPNVEHKISWKVSSDWQTKLAKVKFEVLASEGELLPLETMTIPASDQYGKMKITWNTITASQLFDALLWLYADRDSSLELGNGNLYTREGGEYSPLASGATVKYGDDYYDMKRDRDVHEMGAHEYVFRKMGYSLLTGAPLTYANRETRLGLSPSGARQYGYKIVE